MPKYSTQISTLSVIFALTFTVSCQKSDEIDINKASPISSPPPAQVMAGLDENLARCRIGFSMAGDNIKGFDGIFLDKTSDGEGGLVSAARVNSAKYLICSGSTSLDNMGALVIMKDNCHLSGPDNCTRLLNVQTPRLATIFPVVIDK